MRTYATTIFALLLTLGPSRAAEPTLPRLSFWVPPERQAIPADQAQVHRQTAPGILRTSQNTPFICLIRHVDGRSTSPQV